MLLILPINYYVLKELIYTYIYIYVKISRRILGSVKLHIGDSWGKMKSFALGHFHRETQTLGV